MTTRQSQNLRLFVAIELHGEVRDALGRLQHELQRRGLEKLRWVRPEGIHLTLKFLGETPAEKVPQIENALSSAMHGAKPHELALGSIGTFGGRNPRVLWVDLTGDVETVLQLQLLIDTGLTGIGFPREGRSFSPHLTLARVRPEATREMAAPIADALGAVKTPRATIKVREISLMCSKLRPTGAIYERIEAFPLADT